MLRPGDFLLTHGDAWTSRAIRFGQRLRIHGEDAIHTWTNHAAGVVTASGDLIEAVGAGVCHGHIENLRERSYVVVHPVASDEDRAQVVRYWRWAAGEVDAHGVELVSGRRAQYGFATIVCIAANLLTGGKFRFGLQGEHICSGLVAVGQERTGVIFNREAAFVMPADLSKYYAVVPPD